MVEIKVNNERLDLFSDTKVSGSFSNEQNKGSIFSVPYTNEFDLPLTIRNADILGYDKNTISFNKKDIKASVYSNGELLFYGTIEFGDVVQGNIQESVTVNIIDSVSFFLDKVKNSKVGTIIPPDAGYFNVGNILKVYSAQSGRWENDLFFYGYYDLNNYTSEFSKLVYSRMINGSGIIPSMFVDKFLKYTGSTYNVDIDIDSFSRIIPNFDKLSFTIPIDYVSIAPIAKKIATEEVQSPSGYSITDEFASNNPDDTRVKNRKICTNSEIYFYDKNNNFASLQSLSLCSRNIVIDKLSISSGGNQNLFYKFFNIEGVTVTGVSGDDMFISLQKRKEDGSFEFICNVIEYKFEYDYVNEVYNLREYFLDDYIYDGAFSISAGENLDLRLVLSSNGVTNISISSSGSGQYDPYSNIRLVGDRLVHNKLSSSQSDVLTASLVKTYSFSAEISYKDYKYETEKIFDIGSVLSYGSQVLSDDTADFTSKERPYVVDVEESFNTSEYTIYDLLCDFCTRFNLKLVSKDGKITAVSKNPDKAIPEIDLTTRLDSNISSTIEYSLSKSNDFSVNNNNYGTTFDSYANGDTFGDHIEDSGDNAEKTNIKLKSAVIRQRIFGSRNKTQSEDTTNLLGEIPDQFFWGITDFKKVEKNQIGIRYAYNDGTVNSVLFSPIINTKETYLCKPISFDNRNVISYIPDGALQSIHFYAKRETSYNDTITKNLSLLNEKKEIIGTYSVAFINGCIFFIINSITKPSSNTGTYLFSYSKAFRSFANRPSSILNVTTGDISTPISFDVNTEYVVVKTSSPVTKAIITRPTVADVFGVNIIDVSDPSKFNIKQSTVVYCDFNGNEFKRGISIPKLTEEVGEYTLAYTNKGSKIQGVKNMYDLLFSNYRSTIVSKDKTRASISVYVTNSEAKMMLNGSNVKFNGDLYYIEEASNIPFEPEGGIVKLKLVKI